VPHHRELKPGYAPEPNPDELVWSHVKCTGVARTPLRQGEKLVDKIEEQLENIKKLPSLVRSFFKALFALAGHSKLYQRVI
jgi:hypothetical protein